MAKFLSLVTAHSLRGVRPLIPELQQVVRFNSVLARNNLLDPAYGLDGDQRQLQEMAYNFAVKEFRPKRREWDENEIFPVDAMREGAKLGFGALYVPAEHGGTGLTRLDTSVIFEALSQGCASTTAYISIHNMCVWMISEFGTEAQREQFIPQLASMDTFASYCLTEPDAGSDAGSLKTTARRDGDHYILNGSKAFISGSGNDNIFLVMCRTGGPGPKGISCLIVDGKTPGFSCGKKEKKLGWNSHPARILSFEDVKVPAANLLGKEGFGFNIAMQGLNGGRTNIASCSLGAAQWALEEAIEYTTTRKQFNQKIASFQNTQFKLAEMAAELFSCRLATRAAAKGLDDSKAGGDGEAATIAPGTIAAAAKLLVTDKCFQIIDNSLQLFGGYGYLYDYPLQQLLRDTRVHRILEGTNEVMRMIIARELLDKRL